MHSWLVYYDGDRFYNREDVNPFLQTNNSVMAWLVVIHGIGAIMCTTVIASILWSKKAVANGFNIYLIFNLIPDLCGDLYRFTTRLLISRFRISALSFPYPCLLAMIISYSHVVTNLWINALTINEVYKLLQHSRQGKRFNPCPRRIIIRRVLLIYGASVLVATLFTLNTKPFLDIRIHPDTCTPTPYGKLTSATSYTISGLFTCIPCFYIIYAGLMVRRNGLLPPSGKCRFIALYFSWIAFISCFLAIMVVVITITQTSAELLMIISIQSIIVCLISITKKDIRDAVFDTCFCGCCFKVVGKSSFIEEENET